MSHLSGVCGPQTHYMKPIESEGEKQIKKKNRGRKRQRTVNEFVDESAEEVEEDEEKEHLFLESR